MTAKGFIIQTGTETVHYEEYYVSNRVDQSYYEPCITEGKCGDAQRAYV